MWYVTSQRVFVTACHLPFPGCGVCGPCPRYLAAVHGADIHALLCDHSLLSLYILYLFFNRGESIQTPITNGKENVPIV